ncbi:MAG: hypothetical protein WA688_08385 [Thermoplasmata archaeon]
MALLSDVDWVIILAVGGFLLIGKGDPQLLRTVGRWYGKAMHLKQELLSEFTRAAELPTPSPDRPISIRSALLGLETDEAAHAQTPIAVAHAPLTFATATAVFPGPAAMTWVNSVGPHQWSIATTRFAEFDGGVL